MKVLLVLEQEPRLVSSHGKFDHLEVFVVGPSVWHRVKIFFGQFSRGIQRLPAVPLDDVTTLYSYSVYFCVSMLHGELRAERLI